MSDNCSRPFHSHSISSLEHCAALSHTPALASNATISSELLHAYIIYIWGLTLGLTRANELSRQLRAASGTEHVQRQGGHAAWLGHGAFTTLFFVRSLLFPGRLAR